MRLPVEVHIESEMPWFNTSSVLFHINKRKKQQQKLANECGKRELKWSRTWWSLWGLGFVFWTSQRKLGSRDLKAGNKNIKDGVSRVSCCRQQHSAASAPCSICSFKANQTDQKKEKEARVGRKYLKINLFGSLFLRYDRSIYWSMLT